VSVELFVMPLSRYRSGDFVSPAMRAAWSMGTLYRVPEAAGGGTRAADVPFGGPDAARRRQGLLAECQRFMLTLPEQIPDARWNESSDHRPAFHDVPVTALSELRSQARRLDKRPTLGGLVSKRRYSAHAAHAQIYLPVMFETLFERAGVRYGSVPVLVKELGQLAWSAPADAAARVLKRAALDASELRLPLIVGLASDG
jgi:hypothetical protein